MAGERIGVFIAPFDPIHQGHLSLALQAMETACLDRVIMLPSGERDSKSFSVSAEDSDEPERLLSNVSGIKSGPVSFPHDENGIANKISVSIRAIIFFITVKLLKISLI